VEFVSDELAPGQVFSEFSSLPILIPPTPPIHSVSLRLCSLDTVSVVK
jgi:hypothetical protein